MKPQKVVKYSVERKHGENKSEFGQATFRFNSSGTLVTLSCFIDEEYDKYTDEQLIEKFRRLLNDFDRVDIVIS